MTDIRNKNNIIGRVAIAAAFAVFVLLLLGPAYSVAQIPATAIIYPDIREPFKSVFMNIIKGIGDSLGGNIETRALTDTDTATEVLAWTHQKNLRTVVTLGNQAYSMTDVLSRDFPVVIGAINMSPELLRSPHYGITLNPDPASLMKRLKSLAPGITRVLVVYHREQDAWMIEKAAKPAQELGITLQTSAVESLAEAANKYREIMNNQVSDTDALWLPQDSAVMDEQAMLPVILKEAWDKRLIVFSSNPSFVKRGVLFALYPDNYNMGRSLGDMARRTQTPGFRDDPAAQKLESLRDLLIAFNIRTAAHLGIKYSRDDLNNFDLVFPSR